MEEQKIAKPKMEALLDQEAPHFLHTLMHLELPPMHRPAAAARGDDRQQASAEEDNQTALEQFIAQCCERTPDKHTLFAEFYDRFQQWLPRQRKAHLVEEIASAENCPCGISTIYGHGQRRSTFPI